MSANLKILLIKQNLIIKSYLLFCGNEYEILSKSSTNSFSSNSKVWLKVL